MTAITTNNNYMTQVANGGRGNLAMAWKLNTQLMTIFQQIQTDIMANQNSGQPNPVAPVPPPA